MEETDFKCDICGKEYEELWSFGAYGNDERKKADDKEYCEEHFIAAEKEYDSNLENNSEQY